MYKKFGNITELRHWLRSVEAQEGVTIDFKESIPSDPFTLRKLLSAFANTDGGFIYFGISDAKQAVGMTITAQDLKDRIRRTLGTDVLPANISFDVVDEVRFDAGAKAIYVIQVHKSLYTDKPHLVIRDGAVYIFLRRGAICEHLINRAEIMDAFLLEGAFYSQQSPDVRRILGNIERMPVCKLNQLENSILLRYQSYLSQEAQMDKRAGVLLAELRQILEDYTNLGTLTTSSVAEMSLYSTKEQSLKGKISKHLRDFNKYYE